MNPCISQIIAALSKNDDDGQLRRLLIISVSLGGIILITYYIYFLYNERITKQCRIRELKQWIHDLRREQATKSFHVLTDHQPTTTTNDGSTSLTSSLSSYSANETVQKILNGELDMLQNIVNLSRRCRTYGRGCRQSQWQVDHEKNDDDDVVDGVNAITEELYDEAYEEAKEKLLQLNAAGRTKQQRQQGDHQVLFGVPISVKDRFAIKGHLQTGGMACRLKSIATEDSLIVQLLKDAGAIPLCMSNTVQTMTLPETVNHIWGRTSNPWDLSRTTGGSSGGDAALVAMECVPLALASDLGGSIRLPAAFCGVVGFKPTSTRLSVKGNMTPRKHNKVPGTACALPPSIGPIARTVDDAVLFMKAVCVPKLWNTDRSSIPPLPFDNDLYDRIVATSNATSNTSRNKDPTTSPTSTLITRRYLKIGYFVSDGFFEPCTAAIRGLQETIDKLSNAGHTCVKFLPPTDGWFHYGLLLKIASAEGNLRSILDGLEGEPMLAEFKTILLGMGIPDMVRWLVRKLLDKRRSFLLGCSRRVGSSVYDVWQVFGDLVEMRNQWSHAISTSGCDVLIFPTIPLPAMPHGIAPQLTAAFSSLFIANLLQWPAGTVPVATIRDNEQHYYHVSMPDNRASCEHGKDEESSFLLAEDGRGRQPEQKERELPKVQRDKFAVMADSVVMKNSAGLPMSVSVMAPAFKDEVCLGVMKEVERVVKFEARPNAYHSPAH